MTFKVRFPLWHLMAGQALALVFGIVSLIAYVRSPGPDLLFGAIVGPLVAAGNLAFFPFVAVLRVEPHRIVTGFGQGSKVLPLGPYDRLFARDRRLWIIRYTGYWEEVPLWRPFLHRGDWQAFEAAVARRWRVPPPAR
jgi:hypothetical protein